MIKKVIRIENLGCLRKLSPGSGVGEAGKLVGVFGENGSGKTTLVAALRAAHDGTSDPLRERRSLPRSDSPIVELYTSTGTVKYSGGAWQGNLPSVEIFDRTFIAANVYDGRKVGPDQRSRFYRIALGSGEVEAAERVDEAKKVLAEATKPRVEIIKRLKSRCSEAGTTLEELQKLEPLTEPPPSLQKNEARLRALQARKDLQGLSQINTLPPALPIDGEKFNSLLDRTAASLSTQAMEAVRRHISTSLDESGEAWIRQGVSYAEGKTACPYCGQDLESSTLALLFPKFFDAGYRRLRSTVGSAIERLDAWETWVSSLRSLERENQKAHTAWSAITELDAPPDIAELPTRAASVVSMLRLLMEEKRARLLDPLGDDPRLQELLDAHRELYEPVRQYNNWANAALAHCRKIQADHDGEVRRLTTLVGLPRWRLLRGSPSIQTDLCKLEETEKRIEEALAVKAKAEANLEQREAGRTETFLDLVNKVLSRFGAGFRIRELKGTQSSSRIVADFKVALVEGGQDLEGATVQASLAKGIAPRFDTVLSEGDRTTLALAVFFAKCIDDPDPERIVVLDDPLTSLDSSRRKWTAEYINVLAESSAQVWLLSHDEYFLKDALPKSATFLTIDHRAGNSFLSVWNPKKACRSRYARDLERLEAFCNRNPDAPAADDAGRMIRPILEEYLEFRFRRAWEENDWLGKFVGKAKNNHPDIRLSKVDIKNIECWLSFASPEMHGDPHHARPSHSDAELRSIATGVLNFVHS